MAFVVIAEFEAPAEHRAAFLEVCRYDAEHSVADEPGCRQFDVIILEDSATNVILYEVYDDRAAFETHLTMPHFAPFAEALERLNVQKIAVRFFTRQHP